MILKTMTDLCEQCPKNSSAIVRNMNTPLTNQSEVWSNNIINNYLTCFFKVFEKARLHVELVRKRDIIIKQSSKKHYDKCLFTVDGSIDVTNCFEDDVHFLMKHDIYQRHPIWEVGITIHIKSL